GESCDDGLACTYNDRISANCDCKGIPYHDPNEDGICDILRLPAPKIIYPDEDDNCIVDGAFTALWDNQHQYDLDVDYHYYIWQVGLAPKNTPQYHSLQNELLQTKNRFVDQQNRQVQYFEQQQQLAFEQFQTQVRQSYQECLGHLLDQQSALENQQAQAQDQFNQNLQNITDNCTSNPQLAAELFEQQIAEEQATFNQYLQTASKNFAAQQAQDLADFTQNAKAQKENFQALQAEERQTFLAQMKDHTLQTCSDHENYAQTFESKKAALQGQRDECMQAAEQFKNRVKKDAKRALKNIKEEISTIELAIELAKQKHQELLVRLEGEMVQNRKNAREDAQVQAQIQAQYEQAVTEAQQNQQEILEALEQRIVDFKNQQNQVKSDRKAQLDNAQQHINDLKKECRQNYRSALAQLESKLTNREGSLEKALDIIRQDSIHFDMQQAEDLARFDDDATQQLTDFEQVQQSESQNFQNQQQNTRDQFQQLITERKTAFDNGNCSQVAAQQNLFFTRQQNLVQQYVLTQLNTEKQNCQVQQANTEADFLAQQSAKKQLLQKEQDKQIQQLEGRQNLQRQHLITDLIGTKTKAQLVFSGSTKNLFQEITNQSIEFKAGQKYELQIRAIDARNVAIFDNEGWSEKWPLHLKNCINQTLEPPVALNPSKLLPNSFIANWTKVEGVEQYLLTVSTDETFKTLVPGFSGTLVKGTQYECQLPSGTYCYKIRSVKNGMLSDFSNNICIDPIVHLAEDCVLGTPCDDGDPCTYNDLYLSDCICMGTNDDVDGDGVCDGLDQCPGGDDNVDTDGDGVPDFCDACVVGASCDDGDAFTLNDVYLINPDIDPNLPPPPGVDYCLCQGIPRDQFVCPPEGDSDGDGVCDEIDICPGGDDRLDYDGDGIPNFCDICGEGDDTIDEDGDGIPDPCDPEITECNTDILVCPSTSSANVCDYSVVLDPSCFAVKITYYPPNSTTKLKLNHKAGNNPGGVFDFAYCNNVSGICPGFDLSNLVEDMNDWFEMFSYRGHASYSVLPNGDILLEIIGTDVTFDKFAQMCFAGQIVGVDFVEQNCGLREFYELPVGITGHCDAPRYLWSNGETSSSITIPITENPANYTVTVTCADGCVQRSDQDYLCIPGQECNDYDPCTINDQYNECCVCVGEYSGDSDNDGVCDEKDVCPGLDDHEMPDENNDGIPDNCNIICNEGMPCDDGDPCTTNDTYYLDGTSCNCVGDGGQDSDGDFICDALDQCPGFPDYADTDLDGIPDACDTEICFDGEGNVLDYCGAIEALTACLAPKSYFDEEGELVHRLRNMVEVSDFYVDLINDNPGVFSQDIQLSGTPDVDFNVEFFNGGDITGFTGQWFDKSFIVDIYGNKVDTDNDGVVDLFDICHGGNDNLDNNGNGLPDECEPCNFVNPPILGGAAAPINLGLYIILKFDRECPATTVLYSGAECTVEGEYNCACECVPLADFEVDVDNDGVCDDEDQCLGGNDNYDEDGDGIPNACDEDDPCDSMSTPPCPDPNETCYLSAYLQYNDTNGTCECIHVPDGDDDGDTVCNAEDICPGFNDLLDTDMDGVPDSCDLCPLLSGSISQSCDDGNPCTSNDVIAYTYETVKLRDYVGDAIYNALNNPLDVQEVIQALQDNEPTPGFWRDKYTNLENIYEALESNFPQIYATYITGCACQGVELDSDYDGVCDALDACPGFDDNLDYDGDNIPDGCDQPYYEIECPSAVEFILDGSYHGIKLTFDDPDLDIHQIPSPVDFTFNNVNKTSLFILEQIPVTNFQNLTSQGITEVLYEIPEIDESQVHQNNGQASFWGEVAYSTGQYCYFINGNPTGGGNSGTDLFGCPPDGRYFSNDGFLAFAITFDPFSMINRNTVPQTIESVDLSFDGVPNNVIGSGSVTSETFINFPLNMLLMTTDIPVEDQEVGLIALSGATGYIDFDIHTDPALSCSYTGGITNLNCNAQGVSVYVGQPCDDGDEFT
ncbi:MAG: hypothetical protein AAF985_11790, partial [Bacteroidota bacterium]